MTRSPISLVLAVPASLLVISVAADGKSTGRSAPPPVLAPSSAVAPANRAGTIEPAPPTFVNASAVMPFVENTIYHVYTAPERVTDIALQPGEVLGAVASGDTARWVIGDASSGTGADKRSHVLIKPFSVGLTTNLVITTDRRTYHLTVSSGAGAPMSSLCWTYPQDALIALQKSQAATAAAPIAAVPDVDSLHFNYSITGDQPQWRPLRAFDDGRQTFIEFPPTLRVGEAPPLFLVGAKGDAQLVNYRLRGRYYVVDRLFEVAELRLGTKHQDIVRIARVGESNFPRAKQRAS
ncbi:type IV secretion system protein VirB9 [Sphingomonas sp. PP-CE-1G-424]|nr:P-type conjugative transfer protein TrbG [Sphingomonas sp. PP-CE-1G-424]TCP66409.1 type IV secretion system protein VirB9 [Sphingomonas sp. PP-CE-1G-424]